MASKLRKERRAKEMATKKMKKWICVMTIFLIVILLTGFFVPYHRNSEIVDAEGEKWAILVAGSWGFVFYRHQADICHAYHLLRANGYDDSNIIVFMMDGVAVHGNNPRFGTLINNTKGQDYYTGVPKDYVGENATKQNLIAVLMGNKRKITGGSGKLVQSGPNDRIFLFYSGHGNEIGLLEGTLFRRLTPEIYLFLISAISWVWNSISGVVQSR